MPKITRNQCLLVLLVVLISHVALTIHSGTHLAVDQQGCELCTQHANLTYAVPPAVALSFEVGQDPPETASEAAPAPSAAILPYHQRAPPRNT